MFLSIRAGAENFEPKIKNYSGVSYHTNGSNANGTIEMPPNTGEYLPTYIIL